MQHTCLAITKPCRPLPGVRRYAWALLCLLLLASTHSFAANKQTPPGSLPDVLIWVEARYPNGQSVSITYPTVVARAVAETHLANLLKETGWAAANIQITSDNSSNSGENPMTSVEFFVPSPLDTRTGYLPIEPIVKAFRDLKRIEILYFAPTGFNFTGPNDFQNEYVKIALNRQDTTFTYEVQVRNPNFTSLGLPSPQQPSGATHPEETGPGWGTIVLVIVLALAVGVLAYIVTDRLVKRNQRTNRRS